MADYILAYTGAQIDTKLGYINQDLKDTASPTFADIAFRHTQFISETDVTTGSGIGNGFNVVLDVNGSEVLHISYAYVINLTTTGTGTKNGSSYLVWYDSSVPEWKVRIISRKDGSSNEPILGISGTNAVAYTNHSSPYNISYTVVKHYTGGSNALPHILGSSYHWQRVTDDISYEEGNILIGGASAETNATSAITIKQGTDPTTSANDQVSIFATSGADCTLGFRTEQAVAADTDETKFSHKLKVKINGTDYYIMLTTS